MEFRLKEKRRKRTVQQCLLSTDVFNSKDCWWEKGHTTDLIKIISDWAKTYVTKTETISLFHSICDSNLLLILRSMQHRVLLPSSLSLPPPLLSPPPSPPHIFLTSICVIEDLKCFQIFIKSGETGTGEWGWYWLLFS